MEKSNDLDIHVSVGEPCERIIYLRCRAMWSCLRTYVPAGMLLKKQTASRRRVIQGLRGSRTTLHVVDVQEGAINHGKI